MTALILSLFLIELHSAALLVFYFILGAGALAGALTAIYKVLKPIVEKCDTRWFKPVREALEKAASFETKFDTLQSTVNSINQQVNPNGGSSMNDKVTRIEKSLESQACELHFRRQTLPQGVFQMDAAMNWKSVNRALCEMLSVETSDLLDRGWINSIERTSRERIQLEVRQAIENKIQINSRWEVIDADSEETFLVSVHAVPYTDRDGNLLCFHGEILYAR